MANLPMTLFSAGSSPARGNPSAWQTVFPDLEIVRRPEVADCGLQDQVAVWNLDDIALIQASLSAVAFQRPMACIRTDGPDTLDLALLTQGSWAGRAGDLDLTVGLGELVAFDPSLPLGVNSSACECILLSVPRSLVQDAASVELDLHGHVFRGVGGALLSDHILSLARHIDGMQAREVPAVRGAIIAQVAAAITLIAPRDDVKPGLLRMRHAIRRYIDQHLSDEHLSPDDIARTLGISRSSLYRAFRSEGGIEAHIQRRRLQAVHALLLMPSETRSIEQLAHTFGFSRPSHLTTAFRRSFGYSPLRLRTSRRTASEGARASRRNRAALRQATTDSHIEPCSDDGPGKRGA